MRDMLNIALRSEFTFKKTFQKVVDICEGQHTALGIADLNSTQGHIAFKKVCVKNDIKPIYGTRVSVVLDPTQTVKNPGQFGFEHVLLARNTAGLQEIHRTVKLAYNQFKYRPLLGVMDIMRLSENVIVIAENFDTAEIGRLDYVGLSQITRPVSLEADLPRVALNYNFYPTPEDKETYQLLLGSRTMDNRTFQQHILSTKEWYRIWKDEEAINNTYKIAEECNAELLNATNIRYKGSKTLEDVCAKGFVERGFHLIEDQSKRDQISNRIKRELDLINEKDFADYFLVVADMVSAAKRKMLVGPARGSAAGSIVCYLAGITEINPLDYDLLFERFIDINRHDMPDIDIDFPDVHRQAVIKKLEQDNGGKEYVAHIANISRMRSDSMVNHVAKELWIPFADAIELKEAMIKRPAGDKRVGSCVIDTLNETMVGKRFREKHPAMEVAAKFENHATHAGVHAAGILVCNDPITDYVGVNARDNAAMIDYREAEERNLLKIDVLGLRTLAVLQECAELAGFDYHDYYDLSLDDDKVFSLFRAGRVTGIFQFEGQALKGLCRQIKAKSFDDLCAMTALARPGPLKGGGTTRYIARHSGDEPVEYIANNEAVIKATEDTYGVMVYQEQLMHIVRGLGMSWEDTSHFRKVVSKRQGLEKLGRFKDVFVEGALGSGLTVTETEYAWKQMITFGAYGFNKSHSVAYALISYWTAWAKMYYPLEFTAASLNNSKDKESSVRILRDMVRNDGVDYKTIDPDESEVKWIVKDGSWLLGGLTNIDGLGVAKARSIIKKRREGESLTDAMYMKLLHPKTVYDILFPCEHYWGEEYVSRWKKVGLPRKPITIEEIGGKGEYTFIGKLIMKKVKDLNAKEQVDKRDGRIYETDTLALNIILEDDTDQIMCRVGRFDFDTVGHDIIKTDDAKEQGCSDWYLVKSGAIIADHMRFVFIKRISFIGTTRAIEQ